MSAKILQFPQQPSRGDPADRTPLSERRDGIGVPLPSSRTPVASEHIARQVTFAIAGAGSPARHGKVPWVIGRCSRTGRIALSHVPKHFEGAVAVFYGRDEGEECVVVPDLDEACFIAIAAVRHDIGGCQQAHIKPAVAAPAGAEEVEDFEEWVAQL